MIQRCQGAGDSMNDNAPFCRLGLEAITRVPVISQGEILAKERQATTPGGTALIRTCRPMSWLRSRMRVVGFRQSGSQSSSMDFIITKQQETWLRLGISKKAMGQPGGTSRPLDNIHPAVSADGGAHNPAVPFVVQSRMRLTSEEGRCPSIAWRCEPSRRSFPEY